MPVALRAAPRYTRVMPRVLIVPDKFKGTLTAQAAAQLIGQGWHTVRPGDELELLPMSDGGDGFGEVLAALTKAEAREWPTWDAAGRPCQATWWWERSAQTAIIESARVVGLALLPAGKYHPFDLDTSGLCALIKAAIDCGCAQALIGIGGSATNDGGVGLARALGWKFLDSEKRELSRWTELTNLALVTPPSAPLNLPQVLVAVDVQNPLLGPSGASRVYGPQKGLRPEDFPLAEGCLTRLVQVMEKALGFDVAAEPGAGAAGGLGFGLRAFAGAQLESGFKLFARQAGLEERIRSADLVITGEGAIDCSTLMGKGVGEIARLCQLHQVPCLGLAGSLLSATSAAGAPDPFTRLYGIVPQLTSLEVSRANPEIWLPRLAGDAGRDWPGK
jgi:glycerate kinase